MTNGPARIAKIQVFDVDSTGERPIRLLETLGITEPTPAERMQVELG